MVEWLGTERLGRTGMDLAQRTKDDPKKKALADRLPRETTPKLLQWNRVSMKLVVAVWKRFAGLTTSEDVGRNRVSRSPGGRFPTSPISWPRHQSEEESVHPVLEQTRRLTIHPKRPHLERPP
jgi:hypothetical protein